LKILFDTNVVLDVLLDRRPHVRTAIALMSGVERGQLEGYLCANSVTTIEYLTTKTLDRVAARKAVKSLLAIFRIAEVNQATLVLALDLSFTDFEDAVLYQAGVGAGVDAVVTRNGRDFKNAELPIYSPQELFGLLRQEGC
jgi:predicted nucleic acid-binding protein